MGQAAPSLCVAKADALGMHSLIAAGAMAARYQAGRAWMQHHTATLPSSLHPSIQGWARSSPVPPCTLLPSPCSAAAWVEPNCHLVATPMCAAPTGLLLSLLPVGALHRDAHGMELWAWRVALPSTYAAICASPPAWALLSSPRWRGQCPSRQVSPAHACTHAWAQGQESGWTHK